MMMYYQYALDAANSAIERDGANVYALMTAARVNLTFRNVEPFMQNLHDLREHAPDAAAAFETLAALAMLSDTNQIEFLSSPPSPRRDEP